MTTNLTDKEKLTEIYNSCKAAFDNPDGGDYLIGKLMGIMELIDQVAYDKWFYDKPD